MSRRWMAVAILVALAGLPAAGLAADEAAPAPAGSYVVKPGDTLWTISRDILQKPARWRSLWQQNSFIADPNLIYPGDTLILPGPPAPPPVAATPPAPLPETTVEAAPVPPEPVPLPVQAPAPPPAPPVVVKPPEPPVPAASPFAIACSPSLVSEVPAETIGLGAVIKGEDDRLLLAQNDHVFVGLAAGAQAKAGERLAVVRLADRLTHPGTRRVAGRVLLTLGIVEVREAAERVLTTRVLHSCDAMRLGDRVVPFTFSALPAQPAGAPASRPVEGVVVAAARSEQLVGQQQLVFVDVGQAQGLHQGDVLGIYRPSPPVVVRETKNAFLIPPERLGEAVVIRVTPETATAVLTASQKESRAGDRVVLSREVAR